MPARHHPLPVARALVLGLLPAAALAACSYTEARPDSASRTTLAAPAGVRSDPVVGALPPISTDTTLPVPPPGAADDAAPLPPAAEETTAPAAPADPPAAEVTAAATAPPPAPPAPAPTTSPAPAATTAAGRSATVGLQVGAFSVADGATLLQQQLRAAGFEGFATLGSGPFRVVRPGLSEADAGALRQRLSAAGFESFVVRG